MSQDFHVHFYLHVDPLQVALVPPRRHYQPVVAILTIGGSLMPAQISIDDTTRQAKVVWVDDKGDTDALRPDGAQVVFTVSDTTVASAVPVPGDPDAALLSPLAEGTAQVSVSIADANGQPLLEPDGVTPFAVQPADFQVVAGQAVSAALQIQS